LIPTFVRHSRKDGNPAASVIASAAEAIYLLLEIATSQTPARTTEVFQSGRPRN